MEPSKLERLIVLSFRVAIALGWVMGDSWLPWASSTLTDCPCSLSASLSLTPPAFATVSSQAPKKALATSAWISPRHRAFPIWESYCWVDFCCPWEFCSCGSSFSMWAVFFFSSPQQTCLSSSANPRTPCPLSKDAKAEPYCRRTTLWTAICSEALWRGIWRGVFTLTQELDIPPLLHMLWEKSAHTQIKNQA